MGEAKASIATQDSMGTLITLWPEVNSMKRTTVILLLPILLIGQTQKTIPVGEQYGSRQISLLFERVHVSESTIKCDFRFREMYGISIGAATVGDMAGITGAYVDDYRNVSITGIIPGRRFKLSNSAEHSFSISIDRPANILFITGITLARKQYTLRIALSNDYREYLSTTNESIWVDLRSGIGSVPYRKPPIGRVYAARYANVREGPGTNYPVIGNLNIGDEILAREETEKWYRFSSDRFSDGWVSKSLTTGVRPQIVVDDTKPNIVLSSPELSQNISRTVEASVIVRGQATDPEGITFVTIGGNNAQLKSDGAFMGRVRLKLGKNTVSVRATDINDNIRDMVFYVIREEFFAESEFSDVDFPPETGNKNKNGIAVVYGIESYQYAPSVSYAYNDADIFREYLVSTFGLSRENIYFRTNERATKGEFDKAFSKDGWISKRSTKNSDVFIFFAGHGAPEIKAKTTYLIPYDIDPNYASTGYALEELFLNLGQISARSVTIVVDACFSGVTRDGSPLLADSRPVYIETISAAIPKNIVVFSAASGNEISSAYKSKQHGLFTYFFLKGLNGEADSNKDKKITILEMYNYLEDTIPSQASKMDREQHPTLMGSETRRVLLKY